MRYNNHKNETKNIVLPNGMLDKDKINHSLRQCSEGSTIIYNNTCMKFRVFRIFQYWFELWGTEICVIAQERLSQQPTLLGLSSFIYQYIFITADLSSIALLLSFVFFHFTLRYVCIRCDLRCDYNKAPPLSPQAPRGAHRLPQDRRWCKLSMHSCPLPLAAALPEIRWTDRYWWEADHW